VPRLEIGGAIPLLFQYAFMAWTVMTLPFSYRTCNYNPIHSHKLISRYFSTF